MRFTALSILLLALATRHTSAEADHTAVDVECGISSDANLADCQILLNNPTVFSAKCETWDQAERIACNGACCVFVRWTSGSEGAVFDANSLRSELRLDALQLLQCESKEEGRRKGLVNGMGIFQKGDGPGKGHAMCIAQIDGLERCFNSLPSGF